MAAVDLESHQGDENVYSYRSKPRPINNRPKYRLEYLDNEGHVMYGNIMYDRRVVRGNTYAPPPNTLPFSEQLDPIEVQRQQEIKRRARARKQICGRQSQPPLEGRQHTEVQTELNMESISDRLEEVDITTQTDIMLDRPQTPLFIPAKIGKDVETQIYEGDLFDFILEVKPLLEGMVGKTLEQSLIEVLEEEELAILRRQQREFEEIRNAELVETQRLEEHGRLNREEKQRRMEQQKVALQKERETADKLAAHAFAASYLLDLVPDVFSCLHMTGYFFDPVERDIEQDFLPFVAEAGVIEVENKIVARTILDCLIREICLARLEAFTVPDSGVVSPPPVSDFGTVEEEEDEAAQDEAAQGVPAPQLQCTTEEPVNIPVTTEEHTYEGSC